MRLINENELKIIQLEILDSVDEFCTKKNISYVLAAGTLIGAVRHKGYIPWDDDIDIYMARPDYDEFLLNYNEFNKKYRVTSFELDENFPYPYAKVSDESTILKENIINSYNLGVNIDIFPIDGIGENDKFLPKKQVFLRNLHSIKMIKLSNSRSLIKNVVLIVGKLLLCWCPSRRIIKIIIKNSKKYDYSKSRKVCVLSEGFENNKIYDKDVFSNTIKCNFENRIYNIPKGYDEYLKGAYGNYMELPPEKDRLPHHDFKAYYL